MEQTEFEHIARGLRAKIVAVAQQTGLAPEAAEDVAQDTLLRLWTMRDELHRVRSLTAFASRVAQRLSLDTLRRRQTVSIEGRTVEDTRHAQPDQRLQESDDEAWLAQRIQLLPPAERQVLRLRQVERKSNNDIAAILGIAPASVATILSRARHRLLDDIRRRDKHE